jgi:hypothetical protein
VDCYCIKFRVRILIDLNPITGKELGMNKESTKEKIEIMQAWLDGETIQYSNLVGGGEH